VAAPNPKRTAIGSEGAKGEIDLMKKRTLIFLIGAVCAVLAAYVLLKNVPFSGHVEHRLEGPVGIYQKN
jgi:hypothetical protein